MAITRGPFCFIVCSTKFVEDGFKILNIHCKLKTANFKLKKALSSCDSAFYASPSCVWLCASTGWPSSRRYIMRHRLADTGASFGWQANSRISSASKRFNSTQRTFNVIHPFGINMMRSIYSLFYYTALAFTRSAGPAGFDIFPIY